MKNKEKVIVCIFLAILVISRLIKIINTYKVLGVEHSSLFITSHIASGVFPSPLLFQPNRYWVGGGYIIYSIVAAPFILLFGKSYFSLRLASIVFLILTYLVTYRLCNKYLGSMTAVFASSLFAITPGFVTEHSIIGQGRHFYLNLFFVSGLYCLAKIKDTKKLLYYLLLGVTCGLGVYFYPAFLATVFVIALFLLSDIDIKRSRFIFGYLIFIACIILAGNFLQSGSPWYHNLYEIIFGRARKNIIISDNILQILHRAASLFLKYIPNIFVPHKGDIQMLSKLRFKEYFYNLTTISSISLEVFRLVFITSCASLCWINRRALKETISNAFSLAKKKAMPIKSYITVFSLAHLFIYIFMFSFNKRYMTLYKYYLPLHLNIILIIAIFLSRIWQRNKALSVLLSFFALSPGIIYQYHNFTEVSIKDFYKHYNCPYGIKTAHSLVALPLFDNKPLSAYKLMCDRLNINVCRALGMYYVGRSFDKVQKDFEYISGDDMRKLRYLYQGYVFDKAVRSKDWMRLFSFILEEVDKKYRKFCYIGLGESLFSSVCLSGDKFDFEKYKKMIEEYSPLVGESHKRYFFQGIGEGLARIFTIPYSRYITDTASYDYRVVEYCFLMIDDKECRKAFLAGFCNKDIWAPLLK